MTAPARKIRFYGWLIKGTCVLTGAMVLAAEIYMAFLAATDPVRLESVLSSYLSADSFRVFLNQSSLAYLGLIAMANLAILTGGLHALWRLADIFIRGDLFAALSGFWLRRLGIYALAGAASTVLSRTLAIAAATSGPGGVRQLVIAFGTNEAFLLLAAFILLVLGQVMVLASEIENENKAFV